MVNDANGKATNVSSIAILIEKRMLKVARKKRGIGMSVPTPRFSKALID
jgi:hypothetical protein